MNINSIKLIVFTILLTMSLHAYSQLRTNTNSQNIFFSKFKQIKEIENLKYWNNLKYGENTKYGEKVDNSSYNKNINLNGDWNGILLQNSNEFRLEISLKQFKNQIAGIIHLNNYKNKSINVEWEVEGYIDGNKIMFSETQVLKENGGIKWYMKEYRGEINSTGNLVSIKGGWINNQYITSHDTHGKLCVTITHQPCPPGTFEIKLENPLNIDNPDYKEYENITEKEYYQYLLDSYVSRESGNWWMNKYIRGSMRDAVILKRDSKGNPTKIKSTYSYKSIDDIRNGWVEVNFDEEIPFYMFFWDAKLTFIQPKIGREFTETELTRIKIFQKRFKIEKEKEAKENTMNNYKEIVTYINEKFSKPALEIRNYLIADNYFIIVPVSENIIDYDDRTTSQGTLISIPISISSTKYERRSIPGLRNTSDHRIVLKGIRKFESRNGGINYESISIGIDPGEVIAKVIIEEFYDDRNAAINSEHYFRFIK